MEYSEQYDALFNIYCRTLARRAAPPSLRLRDLRLSGSAIVKSLVSDQLCLKFLQPTVIFFGPSAVKTTKEVIYYHLLG